MLDPRLLLRRGRESGIDMVRKGCFRCVCPSAEKTSNELEEVTFVRDTQLGVEVAVRFLKSPKPARHLRNPKTLVAIKLNSSLDLKTAIISVD